MVIDPVETYTKDPKASLAYGHQWKGWIASSRDPNATVSSSTWTVTGPDAEVTVVDQGFTTSETWVQVAGGTEWSDYELENVVTFSTGETDTRTIRIQVRQR